MSDFEPIRFGKYQLIEKIATGGMAEVYKAKSYGVAGFEKLLVIKKILPHLSRNKDFVGMFINEAKIAVSLNHANVVQVYDLGVVGADYYMAMEFIHGQDLMKIIKQGRKTRRFLPIPTGAHIITEVARGLDYAHSLTDPGGRPLNVVHQDVSPHNILISYEGDVKLVDFGIARFGDVVDEDQGGRMAGGKFAYMSPEQARGGTVDARTDIFATSIILYELITGQRLYAGKDRNEKMRMVRNADIPPPRAVNPEIPLRLEEILLKGLQRDPDERYQNARDLQEDLHSFLYDVGMRVTRADISAFMKEMFAEQYQRESAGSVVNAIVKDLNELGKQPGLEPPVEIAVDDAPASDDDNRALLSGEWGAADLGTNSEALGTPELGARIAQGERRQVEVLSVEIIGLTDIAERVGEEALLRLNFAFLKSLTGVVRHYQGSIARLDSDRLLVMWGLEKSTARDLELCARCASDLRRMSEKFAEARGEQVHLSMGIHRGAVLVGGDAKKRGRKRTFTPWGDTVKLARRLCDAAGLDEVLVSERVYGLLAEWGEFDPLSDLNVKWAVGTVRPYRLRRLRGRGERGVSGRWVKRGGEFEALKAAIARVAAGETHVLAIEGEAGSGKGRFLREIREITRDREIAFYAGRGTFYQKETPFLAFREVLEAVCGFEDADDAAARREKLHRLSELRLDPIDIHILGELWGLEFEGSNLKYLSGDGKRVGTFEAFRKVFAGLSADKFLLLALENFGQLDPYSVELAQHLLRTLPDRRLLLVVTQGKGAALPFPEDRVARVELPAFGEAEVRQFATELLGVAQIPSELLTKLLAKSGGNALFAKDILAQLRRQGIVAVEDGGVVVKGDFDKADIPVSVEALVTSRIDSLTAGERVVLEVAATVGRSFERALIASITRLGNEELAEVLGRLQALKLVRRLRDDELSGDADYAFRNQMCWEVATRGILASRSKEFHNRVGEAIERTKEDDLRPYLEALSRHYQAGGLLARAAGFAEQAAIAYEKSFFDREALRCFQRAILLLRGAETGDSESRQTDLHLSELYQRLGDIQARNGQLPEATRAFRVALDLAASAESDKLEARACMRLGGVLARQDQGEEAGESLKRAQALAEASDDADLQADASDAMAQWALRRGEFEAARAALNRALHLARVRDDKQRIASILGSLGAYYLRAGDLALAERHLGTARDLAMQTEDKTLLARLHNQLGDVFLQAERFQEALDAFRQSCEIRKSIEFRRGVIVNLHNIGDTYFRMGDYARAFQYFQESADAARQSDWPAGVAMNQVFLGYLQALRGEVDEGEAALRAGIDLAMAQHEKETASQGRVFLARILTRKGDLESARELLKDAGAVRPGTLAVEM